MAEKLLLATVITCLLSLGLKMGGAETASQARSFLSLRDIPDMALPLQP